MATRHLINENGEPFEDEELDNSTTAPADLKAAWVDHKALDAARLKEPRQPERVIAYFIAERDHRQRTARLRPTVPGRGEFRISLSASPPAIG